MRLYAELFCISISLCIMSYSTVDAGGGTTGLCLDDGGDHGHVLWISGMQKK